ncbi:MAG: hypothetical protein HRU09_18110 [Oligoflexales bacterium]|nr:hypothetical protein [Oligoflexales bacterium]
MGSTSVLAALSWTATDRKAQSPKIIKGTVPKQFELPLVGIWVDGNSFHIFFE